jgi:hypothetical protein
MFVGIGELKGQRNTLIFTSVGMIQRHFDFCGSDFLFSEIVLDLLPSCFVVFGKGLY